MRERRRAAAALGCGFGDFADFRCREKHDVGRHLGERADERREPRSRRRHPATRRVRRDRADAKPKLGCECLRHRRSLVAERGQRPDRPAEGRDQRPLADRWQLAGDVRDSRKPSGSDVTERDRCGMLPVTPTGAGRPPVRLRHSRQPVDDRAKIVGDERDPFGHLQGQRRIDDVLAGGAQMKVPRGAPPAAFASTAFERDRHHACVGGLCAELAKVEVRRLDLVDRRGQSLRYQACHGLGAGKRPLRPQHRRYLRSIREHGAHGVAGEERAGQFRVEGGERHR